MRKFIGVVIKLLVAVAVLGGAAFAATRLAGCGRKGMAATQGPRIEEARLAPFEVKITETGSLEALISVDVKSNVEGEVVELNVEDGDFVKKNQVLLRIDDEEIREELSQAEANYDAAVAQLQRAKQETLVGDKRLAAELQQAHESVRSALASLEAAKQTTIQQTGQSETDISTVNDSLERDQIALSQAEITHQQLDIGMNQLQAALNTAKITRDNAERELERSKELFDKKFLSKKALEDAQERAANAQTSFENAQKNVENQRKSIESQKASIEAQKRAINSRKTTLEFQTVNRTTLSASRAAVERQSQANLESAQSRLKQLQETFESEKQMSRLSEASAKAAMLRAASALKTANQRLRWTTVVAPMDGRVTKLDIEKGEIITSGRSAFSSGPALMTVADLSKMISKAAINEVDMGQVHLGQRADIRVSAFPGKKFDGRVSQIAPSGTVVENVVRFNVEIEVLGSPPELMPGMTGDVDIYVVDRPDVLQVPLEAVQNENAYSVTATMKPEEALKLAAGDTVTLETTQGKKVEGRIAAVGERTEITLTGDTKGWRPGSVEFTLIPSFGDPIRSLSGNVGQTLSYYVEVPEAGEAIPGGKPDAEKPSSGERPAGGGPQAEGTPRGGERGKNGKDGSPEMPKARKVPVQVGMKNEAFYEILSGITPGTNVLIRPAERAAFGSGGPGGGGRRGG